MRRNPLPAGARIRGAVALVPLFSLLVSAPRAAPPPSAGIAEGDLLLCGEEVAVLEDGRLVLPGSVAPLALRAGLWVGAVLDRGEGETVGVSGTLYSDDFAGIPGDAPAARSGRPVRYSDVDVSRPGHEPLGVEVTQISRGAERSGPASAIVVTYRVRNVSFRVDPQGRGWVLRNTYLGILADPDVGVASLPDQRWSDDQVAFAPEYDRGDLAYAFDEPGTGGDDTPVQFGIVFPGRAVHRFAAQSSGGPSTEAERYAWMRGDSDVAPTWDPASTRAADYRILVTVGPIEDLEPGRTVTLRALLICGELVPGRQPAPPSSPRVSQGAPAVAFPNPASLAGGPATFRGLRAGSEVRIYSVEGRLVNRLAASGTTVSWNLRAADGAPVPAGVYYYRILGGREPVGRLVLVR